MLTALSVARECNFVEPSEPIILVQAYPAELDKGGNEIKPPSIEYVHVDAKKDRKSLMKGDTVSDSQLNIDYAKHA